jgi:hypothetical protein
MKEDNMRKKSSQRDTECQIQIEKRILRRTQGASAAISMYIDLVRKSDNTSTTVAGNLTLLQEKLQELHVLLQSLFAAESEKTVA